MRLSAPPELRERLLRHLQELVRERDPDSAPVVGVPNKAGSGPPKVALAFLQGPGAARAGTLSVSFVGPIPCRGEEPGPTQCVIGRPVGAVPDTPLRDARR